MQVFCKKNVNSVWIYTIFRRKAWLYGFSHVEIFLQKKMHMEKKVVLGNRYWQYEDLLFLNLFFARYRLST